MLVTGTRKGIGRHLAEHYVGAGYAVVGCSRKPADLEIDGYEHHCLDVADEPAVKAMFAAVSKRHGRLDVLVNNAGIASMNHSLLTPKSTVEAIFDTNVVGPFLCSREAARLMQKRRFGRIVNLSSVALPLKLEGEAVYAASKAAVVALTEVMARELAPLGITVNAVGPGPTDTDLIKAVGPDRIAALVERLPLKRMSVFDDVVNVIDFLIAPASGAVTGQVIYLGGA